MSVVYASGVYFISLWSGKKVVPHNQACKIVSGGNPRACVCRKSRIASVSFV